MKDKHTLLIVLGWLLTLSLCASCNTNNENASIEEERNSIAIFLFSTDSVPRHYVVQNTLNKGEYRYLSWYGIDMNGERKEQRQRGARLRINKDTLFVRNTYHSDTICKTLMVRDTLTHRFSCLYLDEKGDSIPFDSPEYYDSPGPPPGCSFVTKFRGKQIITLNGQPCEAYRFDKKDIEVLHYPFVEKIYFDSLFNVLSVEWMEDESANIPYNGLIRSAIIDYSWTSASMIRLDSIPEQVKFLVDSLSAEN